MNKDLRNIDDYLRNELGDNQETPNSAVWKRLTTKLDKEDTSFFRRRYAIAKRIGFVLCLVLLWLTIFDLNSPRTGVGTYKEGLPPNDNHNVSLEKDKPSPKSLSNSSSSLDNKNKEGLKDPQTNVSIKKEDVSLSMDKHSLPIANQFPPKSFNETRFKKAHIQSLLPSIFVLDKQKSNFVPKNESAKTVEGRLQSSVEKLPAILPKSRPDNPVNPTIANIPLLPLPQNTAAIPNKKKAAPSWALMSFAATDITNYHLEDDLDGASQHEDKSTVEGRETHEPSFSGGFLAKRSLGKNMELRTGVIYSNSAITVAPEKIFAVQKPSGDVAYILNLSSGYVYLKPAFAGSPSVGDSLATTGSEHSLQYLSFPFTLHYIKEKKRFAFSVGGGFSLNTLLSAKLKTEIESQLNSEIETFSRLEGMRQFYLGMMVNAEVEYQLNKVLSISLMPTFRQAVTPITKDAVVKTYPYSYGLGLGLTWKF
jgi:hypothetical protein